MNLTPVKVPFSDAHKPTAADIKNQFTRAVPEVPSNGAPKAAQQPYNDDMDNVSRYELDAKLEAIEARMDSRIARIEDGIQRISADSASIIADTKSLRSTMIITGVTTVVAIVLGVAAFNATMLSNMLASFESGKNTATAIAQSTEQMKQTQAELEKLRQELASSKPMRK
jgi:hypothetical protein